MKRAPRKERLLHGVRVVLGGTLIPRGAWDGFLPSFRRMGGESLVRVCVREEEARAAGARVACPQCQSGDHGLGHPAEQRSVVVALFRDALGAASFETRIRHVFEGAVARRLTGLEMALFEAP